MRLAYTLAEFAQMFGHHHYGPTGSAPRWKGERHYRARAHSYSGIRG